MPSFSLLSLNKTGVNINRTFIQTSVLNIRKKKEEEEEEEEEEEKERETSGNLWESASAGSNSGLPAIYPGILNFLVSTAEKITQIKTTETKVIKLRSELIDNWYY